MSQCITMFRYSYTLSILVATFLAVVSYLLSGLEIYYSMLSWLWSMDKYLVLLCAKIMSSLLMVIGQDNWKEMYIVIALRCENSQINLWVEEPNL